MGNLALDSGRNKVAAIFYKEEAARLLQHPQILRALNSATYDRLCKANDKPSFAWTGADFQTVNNCRERIAMVGGRA